MQFSQVCRQYRILDLKTLAEYCADIDGIEAVGYTASRQSCAYNSDAFLSTMGGALFSLLQRIPVVDLYSYFNSDMLADKSSEYILTANKTFFDFLKSDTFISHVEQSELEIRQNTYVSSSWTVDTFKYVFHTLFSDREKYRVYINYIFDSVCQVILKMELQGDTILSLYAEIPQIRDGLMKRLTKASPEVFAKQPGLHTDAFSAFKDYMTKISFNADNNEFTVIEKYIAYNMQFFICSAFKTFIAKYKLPKTLVGIGENGEYIYATDYMRTTVTTPHSTSNLLEVFKEVTEIDFDFFGRRKNTSGVSMLPYSSIVDFVTEKVLTSKINNVTTILKGCPTTRMLKSIVVPAYRGDLQLGIDHADASLRNRIRQGKNILRSIYNNLDKLSPASIEEVCKRITLENSLPDNVKKDSNFNIIPTDSVQSKDRQLFTDKTYEKIYMIIHTMNHLFRLNQELESFGTSLPYVWHMYLKVAPTRNIDVFRSHSTVPSFLNYALSRQVVTQDLLADKYGDSIHDLGIYVRQDKYATYMEVLAIPKAKTISFQDIHDISTARLHKEPQISGSSLINTLYKEFSQVELTANMQDFDFCDASTIDTYSICECVYGDILNIQNLFGDNPSVSDGGLINELVPYNFSSETISMQEYCITMVSNVVKKLPKESWDYICANYMQLCIALLGIAPRGEFEERPNLTEDTFSVAVSLTRLPKLTKAESDNILNWINTGKALLDANENVFRIESFKQYACSITADSLGEIINLKITEDYSHMANIFLYRWFYGAFAILWQTVSNACRYTGGISDISPFCDRKLITDIAFSELHMLSDISKAYVEYMKPFGDYKTATEHIAQDTKNATYVVSRALELQQINARYTNIKSVFFEQLKSSCDCIDNYSQIFSRVQMLEMGLKDATIAVNLDFNYSYGFDSSYMDLLAEILCGAIHWYIKEGHIAKSYATLNQILRNTQEINTFLMTSLSLNDSQYIKRVFKPTDALYLQHTTHLSRAVDLPEYSECLLLNKNTAIQYMNQFRDILNASNIDPNGFCYTDTGNYITASDVNDIAYFLSKDGVWVGLDDVKNVLYLKAYMELKKET